MRLKRYQVQYVVGAYQVLEIPGVSQLGNTAVRIE